MSVRILTGDCRDVLRTLEADSVDCVITSPPYWGLRDYGVDGQIGLESDFNAYVEKMVSVFGEVRRVLRKDGTCWLNLGDTYAGGGNGGGGGSFAKDGIRCAEPGTDKNKATRYGKRGALNGVKAKDLIGIPWRVAFALQADGWYLRQEVIWHKPNPMPESVTDRCTRAHESLFLLAKSERYHYDADAIAEPLDRPDEATRLTPARFGGADKFTEASKQSRLHSGNEYTGTANGTRNKRSVWTIATQPYKESHFATFPPALVEPCILAGCPVGGTILDPFGGAGTVGLVADRLGRNAILIELNPAYADMASKRVEQDCPMFAQVTA